MDELQPATATAFQSITARIDEPAAPARQGILAGVCLAVLALLLAIVVLASGHFNDARMNAISEQANAYSWYESKSINTLVLQGQYDLLKALQRTGGVSAAAAPAVDGELGSLYKNISRLRKEKSEILLGSQRVGRDGWVLDVAGKYGRIVGAKVWEDRAEGLERAGDSFDLATFLLLLGLIAGATGLAFDAKQLRWSFFSAMLALGAAGTVVSAFAFLQGLRA